MARDPEYVRDLAETIGLKVWGSFLEAVCCTARVIFLLGGWRAGKSARAAFLCLLFIIDWLTTGGKRLIWLVGPDYEQARPEYFYLLDWCSKLGMATEASAAQQGSLRMTISFPGLPGIIEVVTKSAGDPTTLGSVAPDLVLECEAGQISEEADMWVEGRTAEKNAIVIKAGTFENDEGKPQFVHFEREGSEALERPTQRRAAFRLPTWENEFLYGDCRAMIGEDATLAVWCPDDKHGPLHSGLDHPMMRQLKERWRDRPRDWDKRFGGIPQGVANPVYEWSLRDSLTDFSKNKYLIPMPAALKTPDYRWLRSAGGMDFGTVHPSAAAVVSINGEGDTWVRRCPQDKSGRMDWIWTMQTQLSRQYHIAPNMWGRDPMVKYTPSFVPGEAMSGSLFAREARVGIMNSLAESGHLYFDASAPEVVVSFGQIQRIHRKRQANGQLAYVRDDDDGPAAIEDGVAMLHGQPILNVARRQPIRSRSYSQRQMLTPRSAS